MEIEFMMPRLFRLSNAIRWGGGIAAGALSVALAGCNPEGAGSIKIENPEAVREKVAGPPVDKKAATPKQAKALELEAEAAKKHGKLR
jgi:hypothetical protein